MAEEQDKEEPKKEPSKTTLTGKELIILIIFAPVVFTWLFLAARIVLSATTSQNVLENIEPLLTALAILTVPVSMGLQKLFEGVGDKEDKDKK
jgi:membrane protein implicated in regulation of membrane protease activity